MWTLSSNRNKWTQGEDSFRPCVSNGGRMAVGALCIGHWASFISACMCGDPPPSVPSRLPHPHARVATVGQKSEYYPRFYGLHLNSPFTALIHRLPLGGTGLAGSYIRRSRSAAWFSHPIFGTDGYQRLVIRGGYVVGFSSNMVLTSRIMSGCRAPIRGEQQIGVVFYRKRSIEMHTVEKRLNKKLEC